MMFSKKTIVSRAVLILAFANCTFLSSVALGRGGDLKSILKEYNSTENFTLKRELLEEIQTIEFSPDSQEAKDGSYFVESIATNVQQPISLRIAALKALSSKWGLITAESIKLSMPTEPLFEIRVLALEWLMWNRPCGIFCHMNTDAYKNWQSKSSENDVERWRKEIGPDQPLEEILGIAQKSESSLAREKAVEVIAKALNLTSLGEEMTATYLYKFHMDLLRATNSILQRNDPSLSSIIQRAMSGNPSLCDLIKAGREILSKTAIEGLSRQ